MRTKQYHAMLSQSKALLQGENDPIAGIANLAALLKETFHFFWVGFYLVKGNQLVLGPFQGSVACSRIAFGKGVCGTAWAQKKSQLVPDVEQFEGHIACSSLSRSEVVVPIFVNKNVVAVLDIDSLELNDFDRNDITQLETLSSIIGDWLIAWNIEHF